MQDPVLPSKQVSQGKKQPCSQVLIMRSVIGIVEKTRISMEVMMTKGRGEGRLYRDEMPWSCSEG